MSNPTRLLIVDDLADNLLALEALIRGDDRVVHSARSGEEALALLLEHEFALAILDVQMPVMNGFELAALMRGTERTRTIPIIFVTAAGKDLDYAFQGYESGAVDFLHKPLDAYAVRSKVSVFVSLFRQRKEIERQMSALDASRREQDALVAQLQGAQVALQRAIRMRDEFMSMVAHELRTPLNTLYVDAQTRKAQIDRDNVDFFSLDRVKTMVGRDLRQIRNMVRLIDDMLDASRIQSGKVSIRPVEIELSELLRRVVGDFSQQAQAAGIEVVLSADVPARGHWDGFRLEQILANLIGNALRYGAGQPVEVSLEVSGECARVVVADHGPGIAAEDRARIFEPYERAERANAAGGLGLGLFITRQLVQAHGGTIEVESEPGGGARFTVTLPLGGGSR